MRIFFLIAATVLVHCKAVCQFLPAIGRGYDDINAARTFWDRNEIDSAIKYYELASAESDELAAYPQLGTLYLERGNWEKAAKNFSLSILRGNIPDSLSDLDPRLAEHVREPAIKKLKDSIPYLIQEYYGKIYNHRFSLLIAESRAMDQFACDLYLADSSKGYLVDYVDTAIILNNLLQYLRQYPFPPAYTLSDPGDLWIVCHHILQLRGPKIDELERYIEQAVYEGRYSVKNYLYTLDYRQTHLNGRQLFGSYIKKHEDGRYYIDPELIDADHVDERRMRWHQPTLEVMHKYASTHIVLPKGYRPYVPDSLRKH